MMSNDAHSSTRAGQNGCQTGDAELLRHYVEQRSEAAFTELVRRHLPLVYSSALRRCNGDTHAATDVAQRVFTALARQAPALVRHRVLTAWLFATTRNLAVNHLCAERRRQLREAAASTMQETVSAAEPAADWDQLRPVIESVLDELGETDREAVLLRFFEQRSFADIGAALRVSEDAARMRTDRALEKLRALLAKRGVTSTAAALATVLGGEAVAAVSGEFVSSIAAGALAEGAAFTTTATAAGGIFAAMNMKNIAISIASLLGALALGTAGYGIHDQRKAAGALAAARLELEQRVARSRELARRVQVVESSVAELKASIAGAEAVVSTSRETSGKSAAWNPVAEGKSFLQRHPEVKQAYVEWLDSLAELHYGDFWKRAGLSPEQIMQFKAASRGWWSCTRNITSDKRQGRLTIDDAPKGEARDTAYRAILGEDGWQLYVNEFKSDLHSETNRRPAPDPNVSRFVAARGEVKSFAAGLSFTDSPLTTQQARQLTGLVAEALGTNPRKRDWDAVDAKARSILSEAQYSAWEPVSYYGRVHRTTVIARLQANDDSGKE